LEAPVVPIGMCLMAVAARLRSRGGAFEPNRGEQRLGEPSGGVDTEGEVSVATEWCAPCTRSERREAERGRIERVRRNGTLHQRNLTSQRPERIIERLYES
jgi:hypothetical protein